jgi:hypothetical protein
MPTYRFFQQLCSFHARFHIALSRALSLFIMSRGRFPIGHISSRSPSGNLERFGEAPLCGGVKAAGLKPGAWS